MFKSGFVSVIGLPNAGKSTLVNAWVHEDVSIVTSKPQTTRKRTTGIAAIDDEYQVIFIDTPGFTDDSQGLNPYLKHELDEALKGISLIVAAISPWEMKGDQKPWAVAMTENMKIPVLYLATQFDKGVDLNLWKKWSDKDIFPTSSKSPESMKLAFDEILKHMPEGPAYYDMDIYTTQTLREMASEVIRKSCFEKLHEEIPYGLGINIREFKEDPKIFRIQADIVLSRDSHKGMVIGQKGQMLKAIGTQARIEMEKAFDQQVFLKLHVVVKPQWTKNPNMLQELGYVSQK